MKANFPSGHQLTLIDIYSQISHFLKESNHVTNLELNGGFLQFTLQEYPRHFDFESKGDHVTLDFPEKPENFILSYVNNICKSRIIDDIDEYLKFSNYESPNVHFFVDSLFENELWKKDNFENFKDQITSFGSLYCADLPDFENSTKRSVFNSSLLYYQLTSLRNIEHPFILDKNSQQFQKAIERVSGSPGRDYSNSPDKLLYSQRDIDEIIQQLILQGDVLIDLFLLNKHTPIILQILKLHLTLLEIKSTYPADRLSRESAGQLDRVSEYFNW